jgi:hypothetical protein
MLIPKAVRLLSMVTAKPCRTTKHGVRQNGEPQNIVSPQTVSHKTW